MLGKSRGLQVVVSFFPVGAVAFTAQSESFIPVDSMGAETPSMSVNR